MTAKVWRPDSTDIKGLRSDASILFLSGPVGPLPPHVECMTPNGWVRLDKMKDGDTALVYERDTRSTKMEKVGVVVTPASEGFLRFNAASKEGGLFTESSPSHRWLVEDRKGAAEVLTAAELAEARPYSSFSLISTFIPPSEGLAMSNGEISLLLFSFLEGNVVERPGQVPLVTIRTKDATKASVLRSTLRSNRVHFIEQSFDHIDVGERLFTYSMLGLPTDIRALYRCDRYQASLVRKRLEEWCGASSKSGVRQIWTYDLEMAKVIEYLYHCLGEYASIRFEQAGRGDSRAMGRERFFIRPKKKRPPCWIDNDVAVTKLESADGKQYCLSTTTGFFVARFAPGQIFITGNTGKSSLVLMKIIQFAATKMLPIDGVRRCRVLVVREDAPKLETSTQTVLQEWYGKAIEFHGNYPKTAELAITNGDGTVSRIEFVLRGLADNANEIYDNLSGLPANILWINEVQTYSTPDIVEMGFQRMGRYLSRQEGNQGYGLVIADFNPPSALHWLAEWKRSPPDIVAEATKIEGFDDTSAVNKFKVEFLQWPSPFIAKHDDEGELVGYTVNPLFDSAFKQPAGLGYWAKILAANSKDPNKIRTNIFGEFGYLSGGVPVYNGVYNERQHVAQAPIPIDLNRILYIGCDPSGFRGAAVMFQEGTRGFNVLAEVFNAEDSLSFYELLHDYIIPWLRRNGVKDSNVQFVLDPANHRGDNKLTPKDECRMAGFSAVDASTNKIETRIEALRYFLLRGKVKISPTLETQSLRQGLSAEYYWKKQKANLSGSERKPEKTRPYSDLVESLQYGFLFFRQGEAVKEAEESGSYVAQTNMLETNASEII